MKKGDSIHNQHYPDAYLSFKRNLLQLMTEQDPLQILNSGIFQQYQSKIGFQGHFKTKNTKHSQRRAFEHLQTKFHQSRISKYYFGTQDQSNYSNPELWVKVIQKRPHSADRKSNQSQKIKRIQQRQNIELLIWTNIMNSQYQQQRKKQYQNLLNSVDYPKQFLDSLSSEKSFFQSPYKKNNQRDLNQQKQKQISHTRQQSRYCTQQKWQNQINYDQNPLKHKFQSIREKIRSNSSRQNIQFQLNRLYQSVSDDNARMIQQIKLLNKQLSQCTQKQMQLGEKQLRIIIRQKQLAKKNQSLKEEYNKKIELIQSSRLQLMEKQRFLRKAFGDKVLAFQQEKAKLAVVNNKGGSSILQELKQKLKIDELRRNTLYELEKQSLHLMFLQEDYEARKRLQVDCQEYSETSSCQSIQQPEKPQQIQSKQQ